MGEYAGELLGGRVPLRSYYGFKIFGILFCVLFYYSKECSDVLMPVHVVHMS